MLQPFTIRTDQQSIKYILDHKLVTPFQQKWLSKLAGFDFTVEYKKGSENKVADALSRIPCAQLLALTTSSVQSDLMDKIKQQWKEEQQWQKIIQDIQKDPTTHPHFKWQQDILTRKGKLVVGSNQELRESILTWMHASPQGGHSGIEVTTKRIKALFYWPRLKNYHLCQALHHLSKM